YDPLISKLVAWGRDRDEAVQRLRRAVAEYTVLGITTTLPFFARVLRDPEFLAGDLDTGFVERFQAREAGGADQGRFPRDVTDIAVAAAAIRALRDRQASRRDTGAGARTSAWRAQAWLDLGPAR
ncbi:MAG TPA: hypothetical protein VGQ33_07505, partial [Vicinamibacteria bacterium]|nr:hypothetical protein [Vicinamibacteria bacterium]